MRPGALLVRLAILITAAALLIPLFTAMVFVIAGAMAALAAAAGAEALMLRRLRWTVERDDDVALPIDERETISMRLECRTGFSPSGGDGDGLKPFLHWPVRVTARQTWP